MTDFLNLAKEAFESSTSYMDTNWRKQWERNIALFQSRHPEGSKYNSQAFKHRSRYFRPKTRSVVRKNEAAAASAFFSNIDVVSIEPQDDSDPIQLASAAVVKELLNYRLSKSIPWYVTLLGGFQDAQVMGAVASYQYWMYREKTKVVPLTDMMGQPVVNEDGQPLGQEVADVKVDRPCIDLIPLENLRFSPAANWTDVVNSSPFIIRMVPMYVDDVKGMMEKDDPKTGQPKWKKVDEVELKRALVDYDSTRQARETRRQDPLMENDNSIGAYDVVWCHENFIRIDGEEFVYWTLGTDQMLTDPIPLEEAYFHGERPIVIGVAMIEAHKPMPESLVGVGSELQRELNDTANQRRDNVSLVLNKRFIIKRGKQIDTEALMRNVAGGAIAVDNPAEDVVPMEFNDVTGSSYAEQDRLNVDFDELTGNFSQSSVSTNRRLNETVGGMRMLGGGAAQLTEYLIRTFAETWVEPVMRQMVKLEQKYETDEVILSLAGRRAEIQRYGQGQVTDELLNQSLTTTVDVGLGATDPQAKLQKFLAAFKTYGEAMQITPDANPEAVRRELFSLLGYKDGGRFFQETEANAALKAQMQEMQQAMQQIQEENAGLKIEAKNKDKEAQIKTQEVIVKAHEAETKRIAALKPELAAPTEDPMAELNRQAALEEFKAQLAERLESVKAGSAESRELLKLAAGIITASFNKPEPTAQDGSEVAKVDGPDVAETLNGLMSAMAQLAEDVKKPRYKKLLRDDSGRAIGAVESVEPM